MVLSTALAFAASFLLVAAGFCVTLHVAARYVLGDVRIGRALAGVVPALVVFAMTLLGRPLAGAAIAIAADVVAVQRVYRVRYRIAGLITLVHFTVSVIAAFTIRNAALLLETAPT